MPDEDEEKEGQDDELEDHHGEDDALLAAAESVDFTLGEPRQGAVELSSIHQDGHEGEDADHEHQDEPGSASAPRFVREKGVGVDWQSGFETRDGAEGGIASVVAAPLFPRVKPWRLVPSRYRPLIDASVGSISVATPSSGAKAAVESEHGLSESPRRVV